MKALYTLLLLCFCCSTTLAQIKLVSVQSNENHKWALLTYGGYEFEGFGNCTTATYRNFALAQTAPFDTLKFYKRGKFVRQVTGANFKTIWQGLAVLEEQSGHINLYDLLNDSLLETNYGSYRVQDSSYLRMQGEGFWNYHDKNMKPCFQHVNGELVYQNASFISREGGKQISLDSMGKISHSHSLGVRVHHGWYPAVLEEHPSQGYRLVSVSYTHLPFRCRILVPGSINTLS